LSSAQALRKQSGEELAALREQLAVEKRRASEQAHKTQVSWDERRASAEGLRATQSRQRQTVLLPLTACTAAFVTASPQAQQEQALAAAQAAAQELRGLLEADHQKERDEWDK
jgi:hypothetical protein